MIDLNINQINTIVNAIVSEAVGRETMNILCGSCRTDRASAVGTFVSLF